jgi:acetyl-CoA decarbonylase/synthase complex subunit gamma
VWANLLNHGLPAALAIFVAVFAGAVLTPLLLPWLPGRAFSLKGLLPGLGCAFLLILFHWHNPIPWPNALERIAWLLVVPALATYLSMNFTGASTYTSLSGVKKEMRYAVPSQIAVGVLGLGLWIYSIFVA